MGREVVLVMALSAFVLPALLVFAFVQLFLTVRITFFPVWSSFKDFLLLLLLFFPIVSGFCRFEFKFLGESVFTFCLFRSPREVRQLTCCLLEFPQPSARVKPAKYEFS